VLSRISVPCVIVPPVFSLRLVTVISRMSVSGTGTKTPVPVKSNATCTRTFARHSAIASARLSSRV